MQDGGSADELIRSLKSRNDRGRLDAANKLAEVDASSPQMVLALEQAALYDPDTEVRMAALRALNAQVHRRVQWDRNDLLAATSASPAQIRSEIDQWRQEGLINDQVANVLRQRYPIVKPPDAPPIHRPARPMSQR